MKWCVLIAVVLSLLAGCNGQEAIEPHKDFPVIASATAGGMTVYLSEVRRLGRRIHLVFRYEEAKDTARRTSIVCSEITAGADSEFERVAKDGWVELRCKTDYPIEAKELGFTLRMCEEPECKKADVVLAAQVPDANEVAKPGVSDMAGNVEFSIETLAHLKGSSTPRLDGQPGEASVTIPYGSKNLVVDKGPENVVAVVCRAKFPGPIPELPRGYSEWDQLVVTTGSGSNLGGATSTCDAGSTRFFAQVSVGMEHVPRQINACFFSASTLDALRWKFVFSGLPNPHE